MIKRIFYWAKKSDEFSSKAEATITEMRVYNNFENSFMQCVFEYVDNKNIVHKGCLKSMVGEKVGDKILIYYHPKYTEEYCRIREDYYQEKIEIFAGLCVIFFIIIIILMFDIRLNLWE